MRLVVNKSIPLLDEMKQGLLGYKIRTERPFLRIGRLQSAGPRVLHSCFFALACRGWGVTTRWHALRAANDCTCGEPVGYLGDFDLPLPALLGTGDKDDETVNLCDAVTAPADLGNGNVVLLSYFNWLWLEGPEAAASAAAAASPVAASSSETRSFTS